MPTTVKVSVETRDHINAIGARTAQTADQVMRRALEEYERSMFWEAYTSAADLVLADEVASAAERTERDAWDVTVRDGLNGG